MTDILLALLIVTIAWQGFRLRTTFVAAANVRTGQIDRLVHATSQPRK